MKRLLSRGDRAPIHLRSSATRWDNIALVPASELASLKTWQQRAYRLSAGHTLIVVPRDNLQLQHVSHQIKAALTQQGRRSSIATIRLSRR